MTNCDKLPWRPVCSVHNFNEFSTGPMMARHASVVVTLPRNLFFSAFAYIKTTFGSFLHHCKNITLDNKIKGVLLIGK